MVGPGACKYSPDAPSVHCLSTSFLGEKQTSVKAQDSRDRNVAQINNKTYPMKPYTKQANIPTSGVIYNVKYKKGHRKPPETMIMKAGLGTSKSAYKKVPPDSNSFSSQRCPFKFYHWRASKQKRKLPFSSRLCSGLLPKMHITCHCGAEGERHCTLGIDDFPTAALGHVSN